MMGDLPIGLKIFIIFAFVVFLFLILIFGAIFAGVKL